MHMSVYVIMSPWNNTLLERDGHTMYSRLTPICNVFFIQRGHRRSLPMLRKENDGGHRIKGALYIGIKRLWHNGVFVNGCFSSSATQKAKTEEMSFWQNYSHWLHRTLSFWIFAKQVTNFLKWHLRSRFLKLKKKIYQQLVKIMKSIWRHFYFNVTIY